MSVRRRPLVALFLDEDADELTVVNAAKFFGSKPHADIMAWCRDVGIEPENAVSDLPLIRRDRSVTYTHWEAGVNGGFKHEVTIELDRDAPPFPESIVALATIRKHPSRLTL